jgi:hypothetical protein
MIGMAVSQKDCCRGHVGTEQGLADTLDAPTITRPTGID